MTQKTPFQEWCGKWSMPLESSPVRERRMVNGDSISLGPESNVSTGDVSLDVSLQVKHRLSTNEPAMTSVASSLSAELVGLTAGLVTAGVGLSVYLTTAFLSHDFGLAIGFTVFAATVAAYLYLRKFF